MMMIAKTATRTAMAGGLLLGVALLGLFGCGGGGRPTPADSPWEVVVITDADTVTVPTDGSDPATSLGTPRVADNGEGEWEVLVESPLDSLQRAREAAIPVAPPGERSPVSGDAGTDRREYTYGHRIQVLAASSLAQAELESARVDSLFAYPVYIEYEAPFFKLRLGDFLVRSRAERVLETEVRPLFPQAWVVDTMVRLTEH